MGINGIISLVTAGIAAAILVTVGRRRNAPGSTSLLIFGVILFLWSGATLFRSFSDNSTLFISSIYLLSAALAPTLYLTFIMEYTRHESLIKWHVLALLAVEPLITAGLILTNQWHGLVFAISDGTTTNGIWTWVNTLYANLLILIALFALVRTFMRSSLPYRLQSGTILAGAITPLLVGVFTLNGFPLLPGIDLPLLSFSITGALFAYGMYFHRILDIVPIARASVIENMTDGWMVLDSQNRIVDLNPAAESVIHMPKETIFGQPAEMVLSNWEDLIRNTITEDLELRGSVQVGEEWRYLNIRISPFSDQGGRDLGKVIVWRDITERRKQDDARQKARDEMFILLHSISGAGSRALNMKDFLSEAIYQIVYSFHSQSSVIFLLDENYDEEKTMRLTLVAHHGLPVGSPTSMDSVLENHELVSWVIKNREPLLIPDISNDPMIPAGMRSIGSISLLVVPMSIEDRLLGVISLARKEGPTFSEEEIMRLTVVADEVATFIHSDRQRQMTIALAERKRLVRDLHDSVTQKLYGLLTLTEAAQAGLEAGSNELDAQDKSRIYIFMSRIGENARQALKEMRLFLYELNPVDLEREGLVSILHQRLAAVEGRSDVKARLLTDDNISLPPHKEVALYFIAQEALNNALRHAKARNVTVRLKQKRVNVELDIEDDGVGFDQENIERGGMGLRNMRERANQVGGKIKINSNPGAGTKITVTLRK